MSITAVQSTEINQSIQPLEEVKEKSPTLQQVEDIYDCLSHSEQPENLDQTTQKIFIEVNQVMQQDIFLKIILQRLFHTLKTGELRHDHMDFYDEMTYLAKNQERFPFDLKPFFEKLENMKLVYNYRENEFKPDLSYQKALLKDSEFKPSFTIRRLNNSEKEEQKAAYEISQLAFRGEIDQENKEESFLPLDMTVYVAETKAKEIIGAMLVSSKLDWKNKKVDYYIEAVVRHPRLPGCQIGQKLVEYLICQMSKSELSLTVTSFDNKRAIELYEKLGFHFIKDNETYMVRESA